MNLSLEASCYLIIILSFNGSIVSRMGVGHLGYCNAYMFVPLYLYLLYSFIIIQNLNWRIYLIKAVLFSFFIFFTKLNANGQNIYQFLLIGLITVSFFPSKLLWYFLSVIISFIMMSFYIIPTFLFSSYVKNARAIYGGYGFRGQKLIPIEADSVNMEMVYYHVINILNNLWQAVVFPYTAENDGSWEYSLYIGKFTLVIVLLSFFMFIKKNRTSFFRNYKIIAIALIVCLLSISVIERSLISFFESLVNITIPKIDRLPSRLMIYPFSLFLIISAQGFDDLFSFLQKKYRSKIKWVTIGFIFLILMQHSFGWSVYQTELNFVRPFDEVRHLFKTVILSLEGDDFYKSIVKTSYLISLFTFVVMIVFYFFLKKNINYTNLKKEAI